MERFFSRATVFVLLILVGAILAIPILGQLAFSDALPKSWGFESWPLWLQIPFVGIVVLYLIADVWFTIRRPGKQQQKDSDSVVRSHNEKPSA